MANGTKMSTQSRMGLVSRDASMGRHLVATREDLQSISCGASDPQRYLQCIDLIAALAPVISNSKDSAGCASGNICTRSRLLVDSRFIAAA